MKIAVLGSGMVGIAIATKLVQLGHQIMMGSRTASSVAGQKSLRSVGGIAQIGTFTSQPKQKCRTSSPRILAGNARKLSILATSRPRAGQKCICRFGCGFGASSAIPTSTSKLFAAHDKARSGLISALIDRQALPRSRSRRAKAKQCGCAFAASPR